MAKLIITRVYMHTALVSSNDGRVSVVSLQAAVSGTASSVLCNIQNSDRIQTGINCRSQFISLQ